MKALSSLPQLYSYDHPLSTDSDKVGQLSDSSDAAEDFDELRRRVSEDGYLYMKGYLDRDRVLAARASIVQRLADAGMIADGTDPMDAICDPESGYGFTPEIVDNNKEVKELLYAGQLTDFYLQLFAEDIRHYDFTWMRAIGPGKGTNPHCDLPYMGRGTHQHMTCWMPYGDISYRLGGLMILEGSHKRMDLLKNYVYRDVDTYCENIPGHREKAEDGKWSFTGTLSHNPPVLRNKFGGRWLTTEFEAGDFLTFGMFVVHASLDNRSENRLRISSDSRYQRASESIDDRWIGANPSGHSKAGKRGRIC
ncbi:phytanoyl-CoA dioxygenase family protein [Opitutia bacterium ISCC 51]|nr:phytanoyl-CoA dioxygenase family protein [Opitutae bacterium ISCC 51]QXD29560.1 phytanoyl-CoA dioxygenase family protein [Opitutae bacterium ISCC 52]